MTRSSFESPLMPRELADAPDIENVPVANWMHTLSQTVMEMHYELRQIGERLGVPSEDASPAATPEPSLIACRIDESAGMDPAVEGNSPAAVPSRRIPEEARAHLVEFAQQRIQDVWNDVGQTDALTLAQNVVAAQEFLWISLQFPVRPSAASVAKAAL